LRTDGVETAIICAIMNRGNDQRRSLWRPRKKRWRFGPQRDPLPGIAREAFSMNPEAITQLIVRTSLKERPAFDLLYKATSAKLFGVCLRVLNDRADAEEALQDVYIKIWNRADRFAVSDLSPMSWLIAIARNQSIDRIRQRRKGVVALDEAAEISDPTPGPEALTVAAGDARQIHKCLDELETDRAAAVRGAYISGESYAELAARYSVPLNTMRTWLRRSLLKLRECLER
jgi:RNA polymerase sigma-70 factor, ECF subfamily